MEINALLALEVEKLSEGGVNLLGVFEDLFPPTMPATHPGFAVFADVRLTLEEASKPHEFQFRLIRPDGSQACFEGRYWSPALFPSKRPTLSIEVEFANVRFESYGDYLIQILCDGEPVKSLFLAVLEDR